MSATGGSIRRRTFLAIATCSLLVATGGSWAASTTTSAAATPTIVSIEWHDGNRDSIGALRILTAHAMHATWLVNTDPILAGNPANLTPKQLQRIEATGNEVGGHTLDHVNVQPLPVDEARREVCDDRNNLLDMGLHPTTFAYPFASFDAGSEDVVHYCNYNDASATAGLTLKGPAANTVPPADPYAVRTVNAIKKSTKLATMERYVANAEAFAQATGSAWVVFVFHHLCEKGVKCGPYVVSPAKFGDFLTYLQGQAANGVVVQTMAGVSGGAVKPACDPVSGGGCDTSPRP